MQFEADAEGAGLAEGLGARLEGARGGAPRLLLQHRRLHLEEAAPVEVAADGGDDAAARAEGVARLLVRHQVEVAAALAELDVGEAVELLGRGAQGLRDQLPRDRAHGRLARARAHGRPAHGHEVAEVEQLQALVRLLADDVAAQERLQAAAAVEHVEEGGAAHPALRHHAPGDGDGVEVGLLAGADAFQQGLDLGVGVGALDAGRVGVEARAAKLLRAVDALGAQVLRARARGLLRRFPCPLFLAHSGSVLFRPVRSFASNEGRRRAALRGS